MASARSKRRGRPRRTSEVPLAGSRQLIRGSSVKLYFQLSAALKATLEGGAWPAHARFATERELEETFGVSRSVVRKALELLVGDGAIYRIKGKGTFVAPPKAEISPRGLLLTLFEQQSNTTLRILEARRSRPDSSLTRFLELGRRPGPIAHITAVLDPGERSVALIDSYSPLAELPWLLPTARAMRRGSRLPTRSAVCLTRATISVEGTFFSEWGSEQVGVEPGAPAMMGRFIQFGRVNGAKKERPLEFARLVYRTDCAELDFELDGGLRSPRADRTYSAKADR